MENIKRTILFTNNDDLEKAYIIDEEIEYKYVQKYQVQEFIAGIHTKTYSRFGILDQYQEVIDLKEFKNRKYENGYIEIPNSDWYYQDKLGVVNNSNGIHSVKHYLSLFKKIVYIRFYGDEIDTFSFKNYLNFIEHQKEYKELILDSLFERYNSNRNDLRKDWDAETLNEFYPKLENKYKLLPMMDPRIVGFRNKESYDHEMSDKALFDIQGECLWDEEHGFEITVKSKNEIICM